MEKEIIKMTPDQLGYKDRGIMKWQGLILSDQTDMHKQALKDEQAKYPNAKKMMSEIEISQFLQQSYLNKRPVAIQANILRDGYFYPDVQCIVSGFEENKIYLTLKDGRVRNCEVKQIRNIEFMNVNEWYDKM